LVVRLAIGGFWSVRVRVRAGWDGTGKKVGGWDVGKCAEVGLEGCWVAGSMVYGICLCDGFGAWMHSGEDVSRGALGLERDSGEMAERKIGAMSTICRNKNAISIFTRTA